MVRVAEGKGRSFGTPKDYALGQRKFLLIPVDKEPNPLAWSGLDMGIERNSVLGLKTLDIVKLSGIIGGVSFRKVKELP